MSAHIHAFGSPEWADQVFAAPPARVVAGRSRPTQRYAPRFSGVPQWAEGGNELLAMYLLGYAQNIGAVLRWKAQPFAWVIGDGIPARIPDFLVELACRTLVIVQVKASRYLTHAVLAEFALEAKVANAAQVPHLIWTDKHPLHRDLRNLMYRLRGGRSSLHEPSDLAAIVKHVEAFGITTLAEIVEAGFDPALVPTAIQKGQLHVNLRYRLDEQSVVSTCPITDFREFLLGSGFDPQSWWNNLPDSGTRRGNRRC
jgi:hypothetical protein